MENVKIYKIRYFLGGASTQSYTLPPMDGLQASLRYRELLEKYDTIIISLIKNTRVIDRTIKINGVYVD